EDGEGFIEDCQILMAMDKQGSQRKVKILFASDIDLLQCCRNVGNPSGLDIEAQGVEQFSEVDKVLEKEAQRLLHDIRFRRLSILPLRSAWMSSWFLRRIPNVCSIVPPSSSVRSSATSAEIQSSVSEMPATL